MTYVLKTYHEKGEHSADSHVRLALTTMKAMFELKYSMTAEL